MWNGLTQAELDAQYDQRTLVPDAERYMARWAASSADHRNRSLPASLRYGPGADETLHLFSGVPDGAVHMHLHGGAWRALTRDDASFAARGLGWAGDHVAIINFSLAPAVHLSAIVDQVRRAALFLIAHVEGAGRLFISGHSSGAHLAACLLDEHWQKEVGLEPRAIGGAVLVSGAYDLEPVRLSARNRYLFLTDDDIGRLSPIRRLGSSPPPVALFWGDGELNEFKRHSHEMAETLGDGATAQELPGHNHFDMYDLFEEAESPVIRAALAQMSAVRGLPPSANETTRSPI